MISAIFSSDDLSSPGNEYYQLVADLIENPQVLSMKQFIQHGTTTCYQHCINVSFYNYKLCRLLKLNTRAAARAGLLHDLFLYDWHTHKTPKGEWLHGFSHPKKALENAKMYFYLNDCEMDIILKHMFPLTLSPPLFKETVVIILVDKYCGLLETIEGIAVKLMLRKAAEETL